MTKLGIISDTHGLVNETIRAIQIFQEQNVQTIIHCGDIGNADVVKAFQNRETHFVLGNMDNDSEPLWHAISETNNHFHGWFGSLERAGKRIAFLHGHEQEKFDVELSGGNWDLLCYGHTHAADLKRHGRTLLLNPGAFIRVPRLTIAVVTLPEMIVEQFEVPCPLSNGQ